VVWVVVVSVGPVIPSQRQGHASLTNFPTTELEHISTFIAAHESVTSIQPDSVVGVAVIVVVRVVVLVVVMVVVRVVVMVVVVRVVVRVVVWVEVIVVRVVVRVVVIVVVVVLVVVTVVGTGVGTGVGADVGTGVGSGLTVVTVVVVTVVTVVTVEVASPPLAQRHGHCSVTNAPTKALLHCSTAAAAHTEFVSGQSLETAAVVVGATVVTVVTVVVMVVTGVTVVTVEVASPPLAQRHGHCSVTNAPTKALLHCSTAAAAHTEFVSGQSLEAAAVVVGATVVTVVTVVVGDVTSQQRV
jgi:hypothetical protein